MIILCVTMAELYALRIGLNGKCFATYIGIMGFIAGNMLNGKLNIWRLFKNE